MVDYSFFALLFAIATTLAPAEAREVGFQNVRHPEQRMRWTRGDDGRWAMTMNGREVGHFERDGDAVVHHTGQRAPDRFALDGLLRSADLRRDTDRVRLRDRFGEAVLEVDRRDGRVELLDRGRVVLVTRLRLEVGAPAPRAPRNAARPSRVGTRQEAP